LSQVALYRNVVSVSACRLDEVNQVSTTGVREAVRLSRDQAMREINWRSGRIAAGLSARSRGQPVGPTAQPAHRR
jgi:hypothetical protein